MTAFDAKISRALESRDLDGLLNLGLVVSCRHVGEIAMHKLTVECRKVSRTKRIESAKWLTERGYSRLRGGDPMEVFKT